MAYRYLSRAPSYTRLHDCALKGSFASEGHAGRSACHWAQAWNKARYGGERHSKLGLGVGRRWSW